MVRGEDARSSLVRTRGTRSNSAPRIAANFERKISRTWELFKTSVVQSGGVERAVAVIMQHSVYGGGGGGGSNLRKAKLRLA